MGLFREAKIEFDLNHAEDVVEKLIVVSQELDRTATRMLQAAAEARRAANDLNKASDRARLTAQKK